MKTLIETTNLAFSYGSRTDSSFKIKNFKLFEGQKVLLEGPSGIGKTTFMFLLSSFYRPLEGNVLYEGKDTKSFSDQALADYKKHNFGFILPKYSLIPHFTVRENLELVQFSSTATEQTLIGTLEKVGLKNKINSRITTLSQGEEQRVGIAKILLARPKIIFADEPTSNLDDRNTTQVLELIQKELKNSTLLMVTHDRRTHDFFNERVSFEDMLIK